MNIVCSSFLWEGLFIYLSLDVLCSEEDVSFPVCCNNQQRDYFFFGETTNLHGPEACVASDVATRPLHVCSCGSPSAHRATAGPSGVKSGVSQTLRRHASSTASLSPINFIVEEPTPQKASVMLGNPPPLPVHMATTQKVPQTPEQGTYSDLAQICVIMSTCSALSSVQTNHSSIH